VSTVGILVRHTKERDAVVISFGIDGTEVYYGKYDREAAREIGEAIIEFAKKLDSEENKN